MIKLIFFSCRKPGSRLNNIIDVTGASQYHGFLPLLVRNCIITLTNQKSENQSKKDDTDKTQNIEVDTKMMENTDVTMSPQQINDPNAKFPLSLATALFSFLYHLASYEAGGEALVSCGMMESLLQVINWHGVELEHITVGFYYNISMDIDFISYFIVTVCYPSR